MISTSKQLSTAIFATLFLLIGCAKTPSAQLYDLHTEVRGEGAPVVVFINGNGATLADWDTVEDSVFEMGLTTFRSDRDGFGQTKLGPRPYSIRDEISALQAAYKDEKLPEEKILVAHSYGGLIASALVSDDSNVVGVVLVDVILPEEMTDTFTNAVLAKYRPQYDAVRAQAPDVAKAIIPVVEAYPQTAQELRSTIWPLDLPVIDIRAEKSDDAASLRLAAEAHHNQFVSASPQARQIVIAHGSGHNVMKDRPDIVIEAINSLIQSQN